MVIQRLTDRVIAQIAAGEVIERPASVVKELVENALDAGATDVNVTTAGGGRQLIQVSDNGSGIAGSEVELALTRHATSKLQTVDDLETIRTLGFRGEALASIAAVSHLTLNTRHYDEQAGTRLRIEGGAVQQQQEVGLPKGTALTVERLFFNTPARLKFLKSDNTERRHIAAVVLNYALAYPGVRFSLVQDGRETLRTHGTGLLADALVSIYGVDEFKQMVEISADDDRSRYGVLGFTSLPDFNRGDRTRILLFVNGRAIQDSKLTYAVIQAYHTFLMNGRYPIAVLMIETPPGDVDVNVHPAKAEVRFRDPNAVFSAVQRAVRGAVVRNAPPSTNLRPSTFERTAAEIDTNLGSINTQRQLGLSLGMDDAGQSARQRDLYTGGGFDNADDPGAEIPVGVGQPDKPRTLPLLRVVGQISAAYIVAEGPAGMYLIDQHAAHERILYEQFVEAYHSQVPLSQQALDVQTIQVSPVDAKHVEENLEVLQSIGFDLEPFGPNMFSVRAVPAMLADANPQAVLMSVVSDLAAGQAPGEQSIEDKIVLRICKQVAVKAGQVLSREEMQGLIRQLERCESPHTCPHGRPTILHMSADQLAKEFGRMGSR
jgi:DNA mismatch repair protein MutL